MQRGERDALGHRGVLLVSPPVELRDEAGQGRRDLRGGVVGRLRHQGLERLPAVTGLTARGRGLGRPPHPGEYGAHPVDQPVGGLLAGSRLAAHQRQRLPHLLALEEPRRPAHHVGDAASRQRLLEGLGLGVDPEQHRHLAQRHPGVAKPGDLLGDGLGLVDLVGRLPPGQDRAGLALGPQLHARGGRALEQGVGRLDHLGRGAVVAHQLDVGGGGEPADEVGEVGSLGAGEGVDRLGGVAHHADLVAAAEPQVEQRGLDRADVLVLVDHEPLVLAAYLGGDALVLAEQGGPDQQDVLHVHPALVALELLVAAEDVGDGARVEAADLTSAPRRQALVVVGAHVADLGPLDLAGQVAQQSPG